MMSEVVAPTATTTTVIDDYRVDRMTGRIEVDVHCHTVAGKASWDGPKKTYGCDLQQFRDQFAGDIDAYEAWVAREHGSITGPPTGLVEALGKRKGKIIG
jgi:hypothetical protein